MKFKWNVGVASTIFVMNTRKFSDDMYENFDYPLILER